MAEWIVKLIPFGNPESGLFVIKTQGGEPGFGDFVGWHLDQFNFTTDIATAQATVLLSHTPASIQSCYCMVAESQRILTPLALSTASLTITKYKLAYDKPKDSGVDRTGLVTGAPGGVTVASASGAITGDTTPSASVTSSDAQTVNAGASGTAQTAISATVAAHHHTVDALYDHKHLLAFTQTVLPLATNESTRMLVLYK